jgi:hypothetical protein
MAREKKLRELSIDSFGAVAAAGIGVATKDPTYLLITAGLVPIFSDVAKRMISPMEKSRIDEAEALAVRQILNHIEQGTPVREELQAMEGVLNMSRILEGSINVARNSYEEKKVPLIANLIATAPFTNTPLDNMINTLQLTEDLSYRQLSILSIFAFADFGINVKNVNYATEPVQSYGKILEESFTGIYEDILKLIRDGILIQNSNGAVMPISLTGSVVPANLMPNYNGTLLINGLNLQTIPDADTEEIRYFLNGDNLKIHGQDPTKPNPFKSK